MIRDPDRAALPPEDECRAEQHRSQRSAGEKPDTECKPHASVSVKFKQDQPFSDGAPGCLWREVGVLERGARVPVSYRGGGYTGQSVYHSRTISTFYLQSPASARKNSPGLGTMMGLKRHAQTQTLRRISGNSFLLVGFSQSKLNSA